MAETITHLREQIMGNNHGTFTWTGHQDWLELANAAFLYPDANGINIVVATTSRGQIHGFLVVDGAVIDGYQVDCDTAHDTLHAVYRALLFESGEDVAKKIKEMVTTN